MTIQTVFSVKSVISDAVDEVFNSFKGFDVSLVLYFFSSNFDSAELAREMKFKAGSAEVLGCSTAGEICNGRMLNNSLVAMAFSKDEVDEYALALIENIDQEHTVTETVDRMSKDYNLSFADLDFKKYLGLILIDGMSSSEEMVMDRLGNLTNISIAGASAGDDMKFKSTFVALNGKVYNNAAVLLILKPAKGFEIIKTQSFKSLQKVLKATKVDERSRLVLEFNGEPATKAYADALGITEDKISDYFMSNPVGLVYDSEPFVRSPQKTDGNGIVFYCNIKEGMELELLESTDILKDTENAVAGLGNVKALINFNCILRTLELIKTGNTEEYGCIFKDIPTIGFSTYGEELIGHINQTSIIVAFP